MKIVVPGEILADKQLRIENAIIEDNKTYSSVLGIYHEDRSSLIPLEGLWYPRRGDIVVGVVDDARLNSYSVELNAPYKGIIIAKFVETRLARGDVIEAEVKEIDETKTVVLMRPKKLFGGKIIDIKASKIPRVIGKANTMIQQIKDGTKSVVIVGMNGRIWAKGGDVSLATDIILKISEEAHTNGLTERVKALLGAKQGA
ncbi:MAG: KH domain-containing protein [Candidatus Micrarchaeales archaeon]